MYFRCRNKVADEFPEAAWGGAVGSVQVHASFGRSGGRPKTPAPQAPAEGSGDPRGPCTFGLYWVPGVPWVRWGRRVAGPCNGQSVTRGSRSWPRPSQAQAEATKSAQRASIDHAPCEAGASQLGAKSPLVLD